MKTTYLPHWLYFTVMLTFFASEVLLLSYYQNFAGVYVSPALLFGVGLCTGIFPLMFRPAPRAVHFDKRLLLLQMVLFMAAAVMFGKPLYNVLAAYPINRFNSDIIPQIQVMVGRLLHHEFPYTEIKSWGYHMFPTYQPLQWLPFCIPEWLHIDYRWFAYGIWLVAVFIYLIHLNRQAISPLMRVVLTILPFAALLAIIDADPSIFGYTVELLIAAYYLLLAFSTTSTSKWAIAGGILLCLLSRYSLIFWLPLYFFVLLLRWNEAQTLWAAALVLLGVVLIYIVPFLSHDWSIFMRGYQYHSGAALGEWMHYADNSDKPVHLFSGIGFACYFYSFVGGSLEHRLKIAQMVHLAACTLTISGLAFWYFNRLKGSVPTRLFLLCSLKIYLVVFYTFIQIPYAYLMLTPLFASLPLLLPHMMDRGKILNPKS